MAQLGTRRPGTGRPDTGRGQARRWGALAALAIVPVAAGACSEAEEAAERGLYVTAVTGVLVSQGVPAEEAGCVGGAVVDAVGTGRLGDAVSVEGISDTDRIDLSELGIEVDDELVGDVSGEMDDCLDVSELFASTLARQEELTSVEVDCVQDLITPEIAERYIVASFLGPIGGESPSDVVGDSLGQCTGGG